MGTLDEVLEMTLYEFNLRKIGYMRQEQQDWAKYRRVAYASLLSFNIDPKRIPKSESSYFSLPLVDENNKSDLSDAQVKAFENAMSKYKASKKVV
tara:strand:+ start:182 stop:466 length:285 start_codon:yes stop_codon:yes gene_type:complete